MFVSVLVRRLKDGQSYQDFKAAWYPRTGFGVPTRVINAVRRDDPSEILSIGFIDADAETLEAVLARVAAAEASRHERIEAVIEATTHRALYEIVDDEDFTNRPRPYREGKAGAGIVGGERGLVRHHWGKPMRRRDFISLLGGADGVIE
jgi:hypothetical protein